MWIRPGLHAEASKERLPKVPRLVNVSHYDTITVDDEEDRWVIRAVRTQDAEILAVLPNKQLAAAAEHQIWEALAEGRTGLDLRFGGREET